jgi:hypothetical protein
VFTTRAKFPDKSVARGSPLEWKLLIGAFQSSFRVKDWSDVKAFSLDESKCSKSSRWTFLTRISVLTATKLVSNSIFQSTKKALRLLRILIPSLKWDARFSHLRDVTTRVLLHDWVTRRVGQLILASLVCSRQSFGFQQKLFLQFLKLLRWTSSRWLFLVYIPLVGWREPVRCFSGGSRFTFLFTGVTWGDITLVLLSSIALIRLSFIAPHGTILRLLTSRNARQLIENVEESAI